MRKIIFLLGALFITAIILASCSAALVVRERPHNPVYVLPAAPGPHFVWVTGEWVKRRGAYVYRKGYWARQGRGHAYYVSGHWQSRRNGWVWIPGYWR